MEAGFGFLIGSVVLLGWLLLIAYAIRNRIKLCNWLNAPDFIAPMPPSRKECLKRHIARETFELQEAQWKIDDTQAELEALEKNKKEVETK